MHRKTVPLHDDTQALVVWTDREGAIIDITTKAAVLLGLSRRGARGRRMLYFVAADRERVVRAVDIVSRGASHTLSVMLRPRDRPTFPAEVALQVSEEADFSIQWTLQPLSDSVETDAGGSGRGRGRFQK